MRQLLCELALLMVLVGNLTGQAETAKSKPASPAETAIATVLKVQVDAWNRGDLKGFMQGYWKSPDLVFAVGMTETHGWDRVYQRYQTRYQNGSSEMGQLSMAWIEPVHFVTDDVAYVDGNFRLTMKDGSTPHGVFTLIFRKFPEGWRIVHDRTCPE